MRIRTVVLRGFASAAAIMAANCHAAGAVATASATVLAPIAIAKSADFPLAGSQRALAVR
jgi:hypothetical protein